MKQNAKTTSAKKTTARKKVIDAQEHIDAQNQTINPEAFYSQVANKAFELFERRGFQHGYDLEDWFQAERIIREGLE
jgi:hypothetical protein